MNAASATRSWRPWLLGFGSVLVFSILLWLFTDVRDGAYVKSVAIAVLVGVFAAVAGFFWQRSSSSSSARSAALLHRLSTGDLAARGDEIARSATSAEMAAAVRALVTNLERTTRRFSQLSADVGAVSEQISARSRVLARSAGEQLTSTDATTRSVTHIDRTINSVQQSMEDLSANAEETSSSILEMSASIEQVSRIADTLAEFVELTSSAIEEMVSSITEVATNTETFSSFAMQTASSMVEMNATTEEIGKSARQSSELAGFVTEAATEGRQAVGGTVVGMEKIQQAVDEAKLALVQLAARSEEIGEIIRVIDEIAGQTNLLALNAAIIAAQAGERGKGFAVVADEIRDLSERTSVSTDEIRTLIENVQRAVERANEQMTISAHRVSQGVELTARAEQVLEKIIELTGRSTQSISEIAHATEEQTRGSQAATAAIEEVTKMVQQTATATQQQSQTSHKLGEQAATVRDYTKHLKRAMSEQESGSRAISRAMQNIMGSVANVLESMSVLTTESAAIVHAMNVIQQGTRESNFGVADVSQMANTLRHESGLLNQELGRFTLPQPRDGGSLTTATVLWQELSFDPIQTTANALSFINKPVHATLVRYGEGAELVPGLAHRWEILEQGRLYRFELRAGLRFHNGRSILAEDVRKSFLRVLSPQSGSTSGWILNGIRGAADFMAGRTDDVEGLIVRDQKTIEIALTEPLAFFLSLLTMNQTAIVATEETRDGDRFRLRASGAGPFKIDEVVEGHHVLLKKNPDFYEAGLPHLDELTFRLDIRGSREFADAFMQGAVDVVHGVPLKLADKLRIDPRYGPYMHSSVQLHTSYLGYDSSSPPFDRIEVRQAVNLAINRDRINQRVYSGLEIPAASLLPPGLLGYDRGLRGFEHDPERARTLLSQAGYSSGFSISYRTWETDEFHNSGVTALMFEDLAAIGIQVTVSQHSAREARAQLTRRGHGTLFCGNWYADFPDPDNFFYVFFHSDSTAIPGLFFNRPALDAEIASARRENDPEERRETYRQLNEMVVREAPLVCLFHERFFVLHKPEVRGLRTFLVPPPVRYHDVWVEE